MRRKSAHTSAGRTTRASSTFDNYQMWQPKRCGLAFQNAIGDDFTLLRHAVAGTTAMPDALSRAYAKIIDQINNLDRQQLT